MSQTCIDIIHNSEASVKSDGDCPVQEHAATSPQSSLADEGTHLYHINLSSFRIPATGLLLLLYPQ